MYNNCKEKEVFSSAIFHKHCLKSGQINYHEKELVFFFAAALVAISKQLFKCQSKLLLNFRPSFFSGLDLFFYRKFCFECNQAWKLLKFNFASIERQELKLPRKKNPIFCWIKKYCRASHAGGHQFFCDTLGWRADVQVFCHHTANMTCWNKHESEKLITAYLFNL